MGRKKIAAFVNSWNEFYLGQLLEGVRQCAEDAGADIFLFVSNAYGNGNDEYDRGEYNIFTLPELSSFDGALFFSNLIYINDVRNTLKKRIIDRGIPNVTFLDAEAGLDYVGSDNFNGMRELAEHLVNVHGVRSAIFIGGPEENLENRKRLSAVRDVFTEHGLTLPEGNVYYGDWHYHTSQKLAARAIENGGELPDAIICANDCSALAVCETLKSKGIRVPEDIIVTGFDHTQIAQSYFPAITSVERGWTQLGYMSCRRLIDKIDGKEVPKKAFYPTHLAVEESCGCRTGARQDRIRREFSNGAIDRQIRGLQFEWALTDIENALNEARDLKDLPAVAGRYYLAHREFFGDDVLIALDLGFYRSITENDDAMCVDGYGDRREIILYTKNCVPCRPGDPDKLVPDYDGEGKGSHFYIFMPLHYRQYSFGYMMVPDNLEPEISGDLYQIAYRLDEYLERYRHNKRLELMNRRLSALYAKDSLTGRCNRFGFRKEAEEIRETGRQQHRNTALIFADINRMKYINDEYGHLQGDLAIRTIADALTFACPPGWVICRFGGDEFIAYGLCDEEEAEKIICAARERIAERAARMSLPYPLSASFGLCMIAPEADGTMDSYISLADSRMYTDKQKCHNEEKNTP
ncbi:MAG: GGDEF domain-containing protein [Lachnospiraceae bacterium]|jgi:diguanylate cyclase (GGDEF)-like protein|nr:GGDEF domain-containing protein [Lachnospiraceae bacterium]